LERRRKEALVEEAREETKFLKHCDLKSSWVKSTNKRIERNTLKRRVQQELLKETFALEDRREMLREMLLQEEQGYIEEMESMEETTLERQAKMRERAKQLKEKRERERQEFVTEKLDQRWR
jgi:CO dehydrogenase/acetyl-CoA synthase beta subunit